MTFDRPAPYPLDTPFGQRAAARSQYGAICYRHHEGALQLLLITSRGRGRYVIPKGWPIEGMSPAASAAREAFEEAGVLGKVHPSCVGVYSYAKASGLPFVVGLYGLQVTRLLQDFPERGQRKRDWFAPWEAAERVRLPELAAVLEHFDPERLPPAAKPLWPDHG